MADPMNPFLVGDTIEANIAKETLPTPDIAEPNESPEDALSDLERVTLDHVANKLLKDNLTLTALELHTELVEAGRELPRLRDFFSNPANFERTKNELSPTGLVRTSSVQTFDSLDFARYSDDGERNESDRVAVLEFELRKAQETIKSLRATLTKAAAENELSTPETPEQRNEDLNGDDPIRSYEKRALNFLVNEYLLNNLYKVTSVTFAEENENQDFEDWDDVGLNMAKPPDLLRLYRDFGQHTMPSAGSRDFSCMVEIEADNSDEQSKEQLNQELTSRITQLEDRIIKLTSENEFLAHHVKAMESLDMDAETVRALRNKSSTPAVSPINTPHKAPAVRPSDLKSRNKTQEQSRLATEGERASNQQPGASDKVVNDTDTTDKVSRDSVDVGHTVGVTESDTRSGDQSESSSLTEAEPDHRTTDHRPTGTENGDSTLEVQDSGVESLENHIPTRTSHDNTSTEVLMNSELHSPSSVLSESGVLDVRSTDGEYHTVEESVQQTKRVLDTTCDSYTRSRYRSAAFQKALRNTAFQVAHDNRILSEVSRLTDWSSDKVILMLGRCLPHIVPNVLLAKREELIPLILCAATLHPDSKHRDQLLNILFNLIKRPDNEQRQMILTGCMAFSQHVGADRVEIELLPQCWEQISHKYAERRLLVAEACGCLAPYLPNEMRSSLVLSMLKQMLQDDKDESVRSAVVRSLGLLMGYINDNDKYPEGAQLLYSSLQDQSDRVQTSVVQVLLPSFALWALELGYLESHLLQSLLDRITSLVKGRELSQKQKTTGVIPPDRQQFCLLVHTLSQIVPHIFSSVLMKGPFTDTPPPSDDEIQRFSVRPRFPEPSCPLCDLSVIHGSVVELATVVLRYEAYIGEEWYEPWEEYNWVAGDLIPQLLSLLNILDVSCPEIVQKMTTLFTHLCKTFGRTFTLTKVKTKFQAVLSLPEEGADNMLSIGETALTKCTVPVYTAGILGTLAQEEDRVLLSTFLKDLLRTLSLSQVSLASLQAAFTQLCLQSDLHELMLSVLWDGVVHTSALVRSSAAKMFDLLIKGVNETLVSSRVIPALVTLASDPEISVRIATIPAFGTIMESVTDRTMLDKVHMQFQSFMDDPMYRDQHAVHMEIVSTFGRVGPNAEPHFRDDFVLPRLTVMAAANSQNTSEARRRETALQLFDAYSALSCCFISDQLLQEVMLPGLHYIHVDAQQVAPEMVDVIGSMIRELQDKVESAKLTDRPPPVGGPATGQTPGDDMKTKMLSRLKENKANLSKIFSKK